MRKLIALFTVLAITVWIGGPLMVLGGGQAPSGPITTTLTPDKNGGGGKPIIKAKWEMYKDYSTKGFEAEGYDNAAHPGAQFSSPARWGDNLEYKICAVVEGPDQNIQNIDRVIAEIFYPSNRKAHTSNPEVECTINSETGKKNENGAEIDNPSGGCGAMIEQNLLTKLDQQAGIDLVCNQIQNDDPFLIEWSDTQYNYTELCNPDNGELVKGFAAVYCGDKTLKWEDPEGEYRVLVTAIDTDNNQDTFENSFTYLPTAGFDIDFTSVDYGNVKIIEHKRVYGDKCFGAVSYTIRNLGNTRLQISVAQDDMGLGYQTGHEGESNYWNVEYDARIGDLESHWRTYRPFAKTGPGVEPIHGSDYHPLLEYLDLSEIEEMDFSIHVIEKWPGNLDNYSGKMWLKADKVDSLDCQ